MAQTAASARNARLHSLESAALWPSVVHHWIEAWVMTIKRDDENGFVDWSAVTTNAIGIVIGIALTSATGGIFYLVWRLPAQQAEILRLVQQVQADHQKAREDLRILQLNDRVQDNRLTIIESKRNH